MTKSRIEYRINKKGAECFRTTDSEAAYSVLHSLQAERPGVYTMQRRICKLDRYGRLERSLSGDPLWSAWN